MKKQLKSILWMAVALLAIAFLASRTNWDEFKQSITGMNWSWVVGAVITFFAAQTILATRWVLLLRVQAIYISVFQAIKLTYLGLFYNNMMPGAVGGDILKGWFITYHSQKNLRVEAAVTVFVDRLVGLVGMIWVGALAGFIVGSDLTLKVAGRTVQVRWLIWAIFGGMVLAAIIFLSRRTRRFLMLSQLLEKLPFANLLKQIDQAMQIYRHHIPTMFLSLALTAIIQGLSIVAVWMLSQALGLENVTFVQCLIIMPIIWLISAAVPVPGGLGIMENLFIPFFSKAIDPDGLMDPVSVAAQAAALALLNRLMICFCSLPGALVPIFGGHLPKPEELEKVMQSPIEE